MSENPGYVDQGFEQEPVVAAPVVSEEEALAHAREAAHVQETQPEEEKPNFVEKEFGVLGEESSDPTVTSSGPQVAYVNRKFGIDGDVYTEATAAAVYEYTKSLGLKRSYRVTRSLYTRL